MSDAVEVVFQIDQPGTAAAKLKTLDEMMARLGRTAKTIGVDIDQSVGKINDAPARKLAGSMDLVHQSAGKGALQLGRVREQLAGLANVPGIPAVDGLNQLAAGGGAPLGLLLGGVIMALTKINEIFVGIKDEAQATLKFVEKWGNLGSMGRRGGTEQSKADFEKLRDAAVEMRKLSQLGMTKEMADVSERMLGIKGLNLGMIEHALESAKTRFEKLGGDTRDPAVVRKLKDEEELAKKKLADSNAFNMLQIEQAGRRMDEAVKLRAFNLAGQAELAKRKEADFEADFGRAQKLGSLFDEAEKLRGGLGGADIRSKNAGIDAQGASLRKMINDAMMQGREFGPGGRRELLAQLSTLGMTSDAERIGAGATERAIKLGQSTLASAGGDKLAQIFALDQILTATSKIGSLTSEQVDTRLKAIEQKSGIDQELKVAAAAKDDAFRDGLLKRLEDIQKQLTDRNDQGIKVTLQDDSKGALKAELGEAPTPESSGAVSSNPFRNDPMSGRY